MTASTARASQETWWVPVPTMMTQPEALTWGGEVAADLGGQQDLDEPSVTALSTAFADLARLELTHGAAGRVAFVPDVRLGVLVVDVAVAEIASVDARTDQVALLGAEPECEWVQTDDLREELGIEGFERLWVDRLPGGPGLQTVQGSVVCVLRRSVTGLGAVDVVTTARSTNLGLVFSSLMPTWDLLLGDELLGPADDD